MSKKFRLIHLLFYRFAICSAMEHGPYEIWYPDHENNAQHFWHLALKSCSMRQLSHMPTLNTIWNRHFEILDAMWSLKRNGLVLKINLTFRQINEWTKSIHCLASSIQFKWQKQNAPYEISLTHIKYFIIFYANIYICIQKIPKCSSKF